MGDNSTQLVLRLQEGRRNLEVIDDLIHADREQERSLIEFREFLVRRIQTIEKELARVH